MPDSLTILLNTIEDCSTACASCPVRQTLPKACCVGCAVYLYVNTNTIEMTYYLAIPIWPREE